jgi:hypothetical protein
VKVARLTAQNRVISAPDFLLVPAMTISAISRRLLASSLLRKAEVGVKAFFARMVLAEILAGRRCDIAPAFGVQKKSGAPAGGNWRAHLSLNKSSRNDIWFIRKTVRMRIYQSDH